MMRAMLPAQDVEWLQAQRSPVVAIIGRVRKLLHEQYASGRLAAHLHYKLEQNLLELYQVVGGCERLFSSPIPPTMTRHVVRSMGLWLLAMPLALIGSMPPLFVVGFTAATAYIFLGIEELGVQVEQPFDILPLWQICHLATRNVEEATLSLHDEMTILPPYDFEVRGPLQALATALATALAPSQPPPPRRDRCCRSLSRPASCTRAADHWQRPRLGRRASQFRPHTVSGPVARGPHVPNLAGDLVAT